MIASWKAAYTALCILLIIATVGGFSSGAGQCIEGQASVSGTHLVNAASGTLAVGNIAVFLDGQQLSASTTTAVNFAINQNHTITLQRSDGYRGILFRLGGVTTGTLSVTDPLLQVAAVCAPVSGVTHISNAEKTESNATLLVTSELAQLPLDVTVVIRNDGQSEYYYSQFRLSAIAATTTESPSTSPSTAQPITPSPSTVASTSTPSVAPSPATSPSTSAPSSTPTSAPTPSSPTTSNPASAVPTTRPTKKPVAPTKRPVRPTRKPITRKPTTPTRKPITRKPTTPTRKPSGTTRRPTTKPTGQPIVAPSTKPFRTRRPTNEPTLAPQRPSRNPTPPSRRPTVRTPRPTPSPTKRPTRRPNAKMGKIGKGKKKKGKGMKKWEQANIFKRKGGGKKEFFFDSKKGSSKKGKKSRKQWW